MLSSGPLTPSPLPPRGEEAARFPSPRKRTAGSGRGPVAQAFLPVRTLTGENARATGLKSDSVTAIGPTTQLCEFLGFRPKARASHPPSRFVQSRVDLEHSPPWQQPRSQLGLGTHRPRLCLDASARNLSAAEERRQSSTAERCNSMPTRSAGTRLREGATREDPKRARRPACPANGDFLLSQTKRSRFVVSPAKRAASPTDLSVAVPASRDARCSG